ncbi:hypothetical protein AB4Z38_25180, partial [Arthrobacter sp. 2RAF6]|uniref:hypothetical protein n=1 Tax=Arthrobacter sp. 2RAF6 TaxID=3233002 RepID=UPI003F9122AD
VVTVWYSEGQNGRFNIGGNSVEGFVDRVSRLDEVDVVFEGALVRPLDPADLTDCCFDPYIQRTTSLGLRQRRGHVVAGRLGELVP